MTTAHGDYMSAAALRRAFDASFARPISNVEEPQVELVALRLRSAEHVIRLTEISGIVSARKVLSIPSQAPGLLGLCGVRGRLMPVFDLGTLLGYPDREAGRSWFVLCSSPQPLAFAVGEVERYLRVPREALHASEGSSNSERLVDQVADTGHGTHPLINIDRVVTTLRMRCGPSPEDQRL